MKLGKEENRKTKTRIEQCLWAHEKREVTRRGAGKDETGKEENWETMIRIDQGILAREIRETTRKEIRA